MELKTCEEYVLNELHIKEEQLDILKEKYEKLLKAYLTLLEKFNKIKEYRNI